MEEWRLADAKNRLTELANKVLYERLTGEKPSFKEYLLNPPHSMEGIDLERDKSPMGTVDL